MAECGEKVGGETLLDLSSAKLSGVPEKDLGSGDADGDL